MHRVVETVPLACWYCGTPLDGRQTKWCSNRCKKAAWYDSHRSEIIAASTEWKRRNKARVLGIARRYYVRHSERIKAKQNERDRRDPERPRMNAQHRRARSLAAEGSWTREEWLRLVQEYGGACAYCGNVTDLTVDHRVPLVRGGSNTIDNILPACLPCNLRKAARDELEFRALLAYEEFERGRMTARSIGEGHVVYRPAIVAGHAFRFLHRSRTCSGNAQALVIRGARTGVRNTLARSTSTPAITSVDRSDPVASAIAPPMIAPKG